MPIKRWKGPEDWTGYAVEGWRKFPFHLLPWLTLETKRGKQGNVSCFKGSDSRRVFRVDPASAEMEEAIDVPESVFAKRYLVNNLRRRIGRMWAGSRAEREFRLGQAMVKAGLSTPEPLACAENVRASVVERFGKKVKLPSASYLLTRAWINDGSVPFYIMKNPDSAERLAMILARFLAYLHERGFYHDDCSSEHFLVAPNPDLGKILGATKNGWKYAAEHSPLAVIDIDNGSLEAEPIGQARRLMNLFQVIRSSSRAFAPKVRWVLVEEYLSRSGLARQISLTEAGEEIDRIARRKAGRRVMKSVHVED